MKTVLISAIGGDIAQGVAAIIRNSDRRYRLIGTDTNAEHAGTLFVDKFFIVPKAQHPDYETSILNIIRNEEVDIVIPISEPELKVWANSPKKDEAIHWLMVQKDIVNTCLDKLETNRYLASLGLPVPWTISVNDKRPKFLPCVLKDRTGSGSKNLHVVADELDAEYLQSRHPDAIYQELLLPENNELTCAVYRTKDKRIAVIQLRRKLSGGLTSWAEVVNDSQVLNMCEVIANSFDLIGSINVQLRITDDGPRVFEINPRFSSTALMRHELGFYDVIWSLDEAQDREISLASDIRHGVAVRTYQAEILQ